MNTLVRSLVACACALSPAFLIANDTTSEEKAGEDTKNWNIAADFNQIGSQRFSHRHHHRGHLMYREGNMLATYQQELSKTAGITYSIGENATKFGWTHHNHPKQKYFHNVLLGIGGYAMKLDDWDVDGALLLQTNTKHFSLSRYTFFRGLVHGRYRWTENSGLHVGIIGTSGMRYTKVLPVLGYDKKFNDKWRLNAIFPLNISAIYTLTDKWSAELAVRYFLSRQRLTEHENRRRALIAYRNVGYEFGFNYMLDNRVSANIHVGFTGKGRLRYGNRADKHRHHYRLDTTGYAGCEAAFHF